MPHFKPNEYIIVISDDFAENLQKGDALQVKTYQKILKYEGMTFENVYTFQTVEGTWGAVETNCRKATPAEIQQIKAQIKKLRRIPASTTHLVLKNIGKYLPAEANLTAQFKTATYILPIISKTQHLTKETVTVQFKLCNGNPHKIILDTSNPDIIWDIKSKKIPPTFFLLQPLPRSQFQSLSKLSNDFSLNLKTKINQASFLTIQKIQINKKPHTLVYTIKESKIPIINLHLYGCFIDLKEVQKILRKEKKCFEPNFTTTHLKCAIIERFVFKPFKQKADQAKQQYQTTLADIQNNKNLVLKKMSSIQKDFQRLNQHPKIQKITFTSTNTVKIETIPLFINLQEFGKINLGSYIFTIEHTGLAFKISGALKNPISGLDYSHPCIQARGDICYGNGANLSRTFKNAHKIYDLVLFTIKVIESEPDGPFISCERFYESLPLKFKIFQKIKQRLSRKTK